MSKKKCNWILFCIGICLFSQGLRAQNEGNRECSSIANLATHRQNQLLFAKIVEQDLQKMPRHLTAQQQADELNQRIASLAKQALQSGLDLSIYRCEVKPSSFLQFAMIPLWEGGRQTLRKVPLTFFIYAWPPEWLAKSRLEAARSNGVKELSDSYATSVHGHPILCALAILRGSVDQETYCPIQNGSYRLARKIKTETLTPGDAVIDDRSDGFVHRLVCRDKGRACALSLHGYGAPTVEAVKQQFYKNYSPYTYRHILEEDGSITVRDW